MSADEGSTLMAWLMLLEPELLVTVRVTVYDAAVANVYVGLWTALVDPSPNFHCQEVGEPMDVSVNFTAWPAVGEDGETVKDAVSAGTTVTVRFELWEPELLTTVSVTV